MKPSKLSCKLAAALLLGLGTLTGCQSDGDGSHVTNNYYGTGYRDPWYYGDYNDNRDVIVTPPPDNNQPGNGTPDNGLRPTHPIAKPPQVSRPPSPSRPSIPSVPRPAPRGGGGRGR